MGNIYDFEKAHRRAQSYQSVDKVIGQFNQMEEKAAAVIQEYRALVASDVQEAIIRLPEFIRKVRHANPEPALEAMCGGPNQDWVGPILSTIGDAYPHFERKQRTQVLELCMNYLDGCNYFNAQDHVALIDDPWLVSDIIMTRPLYWPGYNHYREILKTNRTWADVSPKIDTARSAFWMAYAITRKESVAPQVRKNFYARFPNLMDRTMDGIAAFVYDDATRDTEREGTDLNGNIQKGLFKYDPKLGSRIISKTKEQKWIKLSK